MNSETKTNGGAVIGAISTRVLDYIANNVTDFEGEDIKNRHRHSRAIKAMLPPAGKTASHLIIEIAFALVIAAMLLSMGAAFCLKFLRWALE